MSDSIHAAATELRGLVNKELVAKPTERAMTHVFIDAAEEILSSVVSIARSLEKQAGR